MTDTTAARRCALHENGDPNCGWPRAVSITGNGYDATSIAPLPAEGKQPVSPAEVEAAAIAIWQDERDETEWKDLREYGREAYRDTARRALAAARSVGEGI